MTDGATYGMYWKPQKANILQMLKTVESNLIPYSVVGSWLFMIKNTFGTNEPVAFLLKTAYRMDKVEIASYSI